MNKVSSRRRGFGKCEKAGACFCGGFSEHIVEIIKKKSRRPLLSIPLNPDFFMQRVSQGCIRGGCSPRRRAGTFKESPLDPESLPPPLRCQLIIGFSFDQEILASLCPIPISYSGTIAFMFVTLDGMKLQKQIKRALSSPEAIDYVRGLLEEILSRT